MVTNRKVRVMVTSTDRNNNRQLYRKDRFKNGFSNDKPRRELERFPRFAVGERVYVPWKNRMAVVDRVEFDPIWGPQLYAQVLPNEGESWVSEHFWFQWDQVQKLNRTHFQRGN